MRLGVTNRLIHGARTTPRPTIQLSNQSVIETASVGTVVGILSVTNGTGTYVHTLTDAGPGSKFSLTDLGNGTAELRVAGALDADLQPMITVGISATNGVTPTSRSFAITVTADAVNNDGLMDFGLIEGNPL